MDVSTNRGDPVTGEDMDRLRDSWRRYWRASDQWQADCEAKRQAARLAWRANPSKRYIEPIRETVPKMPAEFHRLICGARTRFGTLCKRRDLYRSGRCRLHGGLSTGPRSQEGKANSAKNSRRLSPKRTPCERQGYGKVQERNEPHGSFAKVDPARRGNVGGGTDGL